MKLSGLLIHATCEIASGSKPGFDAAKKRPVEGLKRPWPLCEDIALGKRRSKLIKMDAAVKAKVNQLFNH